MAMDTFFLSHGSPTMSIDESVPARHFLKAWGDKVMPPASSPKPKAILIVSAHWDTSEPCVNAVSGKNDTIYDFYGFPTSMYKLKYPAPGAPDLAHRVKDLLTTAGFGPVRVDKKRGLDHGAWVPLMLMYPDADIPVCQLSVQSSRDGTHHYELGRALAPLRGDGVLVVGSGSATHNLRTMGPDGAEPPRWAKEFDGWLCDAVVQGKHDELNHYEQAAPHAKMAHPWPEHFFPLHVALGAAGEGARAELIHSSWTNQSLSYSSFRFTAAADGHR